MTITVDSNLDQALERAKTLPKLQQKRLGQWMNDFVAQEQRDTVRLNPEQEIEVHRRVHLDPEQPVSEDEAEAFFSRHT